MPVPVRTTAWAQASMDDKEYRQRPGSLPHTETMPANLGSQIWYQPRGATATENPTSLFLFISSCLLLSR